MFANHEIRHRAHWISYGKENIITLIKERVPVDVPGRLRQSPEDGRRLKQVKCYYTRNKDAESLMKESIYNFYTICCIQFLNCRGKEFYRSMKFY